MPYIDEVMEEISINNILAAQRIDRHHDELRDETIRTRPEQDGTQLTAACSFSGSAAMLESAEHVFVLSVDVTKGDEEHTGVCFLPKIDVYVS